MEHTAQGPARHHRSFAVGACVRDAFNALPLVTPRVLPTALLAGITYGIVMAGGRELTATVVRTPRVIDWLASVSGGGAGTGERIATALMTSAASLLGNVVLFVALGIVSLPFWYWYTRHEPPEPAGEAPQPLVSAEGAQDALMEHGRRALPGLVSAGFAYGFVLAVVMLLLELAAIPGTLAGAVVGLVLLAALALVGVRLAFAPYASALHRVGGIAPLRGSWHLVRGRFWRVLGLHVVVFGVLVVPLVIVFATVTLLVPGVVGTIAAWALVGAFAVPLFAGTFMSAYHRLTAFGSATRIRAEEAPARP